jgi:hypothetical protein
MEEVIYANQMGFLARRQRLETLLECHDGLDSIITESYLIAHGLKHTIGNYFHANQVIADSVTTSYKNIEMINKEIIETIKNHPSYSERNTNPVYKFFCAFCSGNGNEPLARQKSEIKKLKSQMAKNNGHSHIDNIVALAKVNDRIESFYTKYIMMMNGSLESEEDKTVVPFHGANARHIKALYTQAVYELQSIKKIMAQAEKYSSMH